MIKRLSVLDLSPVSSGSGSSQALKNTVGLARFADQNGFTRHWLAEHHNMPSIASSSPAIMAAILARETKNIRIGSGGIMLPNHSPLKVAEDFKLLESLFPGRIDLGIGRAPGTDQKTARALRQTDDLMAGQDLALQLAELESFSEGSFPENHPFKGIRAMPEDIPLPPVWILGSSFYSSELAAARGLPYAFAHHINPEDTIRAIEVYKALFRPSDKLKEPEFFVTVSVICAETDEEADYLASSLDLSMIRLRQNRPGPIASPEEAQAELTGFEKEFALALRSRFIIGSPERVRQQLEMISEITGTEEIMVMTITHSHEKRVRSYELLAKEFNLK
jgi:luciferase family oxidoreductase group 1